MPLLMTFMALRLFPPLISVRCTSADLQMLGWIMDHSSRKKVRCRCFELCIMFKVRHETSSVRQEKL